MYFGKKIFKKKNETALDIDLEYLNWVFYHS